MLIVLLIFLTPALGFVWLRAMSRETAQRSALWHTRDMLIRHFTRTLGEWPQSWGDLEEDFEPADAGYGTPSLDVLKQQVEVDFGFDAATFLKEQNPSVPRIVWLKNDAETKAVIETNTRLADAMRTRQENVDNR